MKTHPSGTAKDGAIEQAGTGTIPGTAAAIGATAHTGPGTEADSATAVGAAALTGAGALTDVHPAPPEPDDARLEAWRAFLFAQSTLLPLLDSELRAETGLTLAEFDALAQLAFTREGRLRMSQLADRVLLSRSGVTRLVDRLERAGYVRREACAPDARGAYAVLTGSGRRAIRAAMPVHLAAVDAHFLAHLAAADVTALRDALGKVAAANGRPLPAPQHSTRALERLTG